MYTLKLDFPNLPKGGEVDIPGLDGILENGKTYAVTKEQADAYRVHHQRPVVSATHGDATEWDLGPTLLEAYKDVVGVTVEVAKAPQSGGSN